MKKQIKIKGFSDPLQVHLCAFVVNIRLKGKFRTESKVNVIEGQSFLE